MKILAVSDEPSQRYYDYYHPGSLADFDLILSCGDLSPQYLEFLVTMARCPLVYVHGNHDEVYRREPEGCICADDCLIEYGGLRILGLGGSYRYRNGTYMYSERQMLHRVPSPTAGLNALTHCLSGSSRAILCTVTSTATTASTFRSACRRAARP